MVEKLVHSTNVDNDQALSSVATHHDSAESLDIAIELSL